MAKEYLHLFKNNIDFETQYYSKTLIKSITCSIGTFTYDRTESYFDDNMNNIENDYIYKNGELETILFNRSIISTDGNIEVKINDEWVNYPIESIEYEDAYYEPWVSTTEMTVPTEMTATYYEWDETAGEYGDYVQKTVSLTLINDGCDVIINISEKL